MSVVEFLGALAFKYRSGTRDLACSRLREISSPQDSQEAKIPSLIRFNALQLAQVQLLVVLGMRFSSRRRALLDTGTVNFIRHLVGIGGDSLAGLGVETFFELSDLSLDPAFRRSVGLLS